MNKPTTSKVVYEGTADTQIFNKADFEKAGVEGGSKLTFPRGVEVEVPRQIAEALTSSEGLFGDFVFSSVEEKPEEKSKP